MKNITVAIDFNEAQGCVIKAAASLAKSCDSKLHVVHVCQADTRTGLPAVHTNIEDRENELQKERADLKTLIDGLRADGVDAEGFMKSDETAKGILDFADHRKADVIVIGSHGRKGAENSVMGRVATSVVRNSKIPVLIVPTTSKA